MPHSLDANASGRFRIKTRKPLAFISVSPPGMRRPVVDVRKFREQTIAALYEILRMIRRFRTIVSGSLGD